MRYALGLSMVGSGALLIYSGFKNRSAWDIVRQAISPGAPTRQPVSNQIVPGMVPGTNTPVTGPVGSW